MVFFLGFDTSCYTTSVAAVDGNGQLLADERQILTVKPGRRGLAQSEMVFQHVKNLPALMTALWKKTDGMTMAGVGVSAFPRDVPGSYMPAFVVGRSFATVLAAGDGVSLHLISHQTGHILAGMWSAGMGDENDFLALHVSGGTTELVRVQRMGAQWRLTLLGGTVDLHAGQFIDRVGVRLGLPFPAGPHLEELARQGRPGKVDIPAAVDGLKISFSGPETAAARLIARGYAAPDVAWAVQMCVARTLAKLLHCALKKTGLSHILLVGGVTANLAIRQVIHELLTESTPDVHLYFPAPAYSRDNAVGAALAARDAAFPDTLADNGA